MHACRVVFRSNFLKSFPVRGAPVGTISAKFVGSEMPLSRSKDAVYCVASYRLRVPFFFFTSRLFSVSRLKTETASAAGPCPFQGTTPTRSVYFYWAMRNDYIFHPAGQRASERERAETAKEKQGCYATTGRVCLCCACETEREGL